MQTIYNHHLASTGTEQHQHDFFFHNLLQPVCELYNCFLKITTAHFGENTNTHSVATRPVKSSVRRHDLSHAFPLLLELWSYTVKDLPSCPTAKFDVQNIKWRGSGVENMLQVF